MGREVAFDHDPALTLDEVKAILEDAPRRARLFATGLPLRLGEYILPPTASLEAPGVMYICTIAGVTGAAPSWPTSPAYPVYSGGAQLRYAGPYDGVQWNIREAIRECWRLKMSKASELFNTSTDGNRLERSQIFEMCRQRFEACGPGSWG